MYRSDSFVYKGFHIELCQDEDADGPDACGDTELFVGRVESRNYAFGRKNWGKSDAIPHIPWGEGPWDFKKCSYEDLAENVDTEAELREAWEERHDPTWAVFPVRIVGSARLRECEHEEAHGYIFVKRPWSNDLERLTHPDFDEEHLKDCLLDEWNQYLEGDIYMYRILDSDGNLIESCGGIYGHQECLDEAKSVADALDGQTYKLAVMVTHGSLPLPFPSRVLSDVEEIEIPLHIGVDSAVEWAWKEGPYKDSVDVISIAKFQPVRSAAN